MTSLALASPRCRLRPFHADDADFLAAHWAPESPVIEFMAECCLAGLDESRAEIEASLERGRRDSGLCNHIVELATQPGRPVGTCGAWLIAATPGGDKVGERWAPASGTEGLVREIELGFDLAPAVWGDGLATELATALVALLRADDRGQGCTLVAYVDEPNVASLRVCAKAGLVNVGLRDMMGAPAVRLELLPPEQGTGVAGTSTKPAPCFIHTV